LGAYRLRGMSPTDVLARVPEDAHCYVTVDIDVLDPSFAPATGHPLPGGMDLPALEATLEALAVERRLVGADLVEIAPDAPGGWLTLVSGLRLLTRLCDGFLRSGRQRREE
jgi:agmatinase